MTDASDTPSPSTSNGAGAVGESDETGGNGERNAARVELEDGPEDDIEQATVDFEDLTLPQRIFVAAVQNPTRGALVGLLLLFGFGFYVAFWFAFPRVAALLSAIAVLVGGVIAAVLVLLK